jgi:hypothetical protein
LKPAAVITLLLSLFIAGIIVWDSQNKKRQVEQTDKFLEQHGQPATRFAFRNRSERKGKSEHKYIDYFFIVDGKRYDNSKSISINEYIPLGKYLVTYYPADPTINSISFGYRIQAQDSLSEEDFTKAMTQSFEQSQ